MSEAEVFSKLAGWTEEMYTGVEHAWRQERQKQLPAYHALCRKYLEQLCAVLPAQTGGELFRQQQRRLRLLCDDFELLGGSIAGRYRLCLCGCAGAGKSTLLNALLLLDEAAGSAPGRPPDSLIVNTYTSALPPARAEVRSIAADGKLKRKQLSRADAAKRAADEDTAFLRSRDACRKKIDELCDGVWLEDERERIRSDTYRRNLRRAYIQEICWGIGESPFSRRFALSETPGFAREVCFAGRLRELRSCDTDVLIWVIDAAALDRAAVIEAYHEEMRLAEEMLDNHVIVVNIRGSGGNVRPGSSRWEGLRRKAEAVFDISHRLRAVACVNARLAWESVLKDDAGLAETAGLPQLRALLERQFAREDTDEYLAEQLARLDGAVDRCRRETEGFCRTLDALLDEYRARDAELEAQAAECRQLFEQRKAELLAGALPDIQKRIRENEAAVGEMFRTAAWDTELLEQKILRKSELEAAMTRLAEANVRDIQKRFRALRKQCASGLNRSQAYQKASQRVYAGPLAEESAGMKAQAKLPEDLCLKIFRNAGASFLSSSSIFKPTAAVPIQTPGEYLYTQLGNALNAWVQSITADGLLEASLSRCRETLSKAMSDACAPCEQARSVRGELGRLLEKPPRMAWQDVPVSGLLSPK